MSGRAGTWGWEARTRACEGSEGVAKGGSPLCIITSFIMRKPSGFQCIFATVSKQWEVDSGGRTLSNGLASLLPTWSCLGWDASVPDFDVLQSILIIKPMRYRFLQESIAMADKGVVDRGYRKKPNVRE